MVLDRPLKHHSKSGSYVDCGLSKVHYIVIGAVEYTCSPTAASLNICVAIYINTGHDA